MLWALLIPIAFGVLSCRRVEEPPPSQPSPPSIPSPHTGPLFQQHHTDLQGSLGNVSFYRDMHYRGNQLPRPEVIRAQWFLLRQLEAAKPRVLFVEGLQRRMTAREVRDYVFEHTEDANRGRVQQLLNTTPLPIEAPNGAGVFVAHAGAAKIYAARNTNLSDLILLPIGTADQIRQTNEIFRECDESENPNACYENHREFVYDTRESWAVDQMIAWFRDPSNSNRRDISIVFGALHSICDDFQSKFYPVRIESYWNPEVYVVAPACR